MRAMITGHRPHTLGGHNPAKCVSDIKDYLRNTANNLLTYHGDDLVFISGGATGVDQWWAEIALEYGIPYELFLPFPTFTTRWESSVQQRFDILYENASAINMIRQEYAPQAYSDRNRAMAESCTYAIAIWNGRPSGTANAIAHLKQLGKEIEFYFPKD